MNFNLRPGQAASPFKESRSRCFQFLAVNSRLVRPFPPPERAKQVFLFKARGVLPYGQHSARSPTASGLGLLVFSGILPTFCVEGEAILLVLWAREFQKLAEVVVCVKRVKARFHPKTWRRENGVGGASPRLCSSRSLDGCHLSVEGRGRRSAWKPSHRGPFPSTKSHRQAVPLPSLAGDPLLRRPCFQLLTPHCPEARGTVGFA